MKIALITGITGQDGSYLAEFLLEKGYDVHGIVRRSSTEKKERIEHLISAENFHLHYGDLTDSLSLVKILQLLFVALRNLILFFQYFQLLKLP